MTKHLQKFTAVLLAVIMTLGVFTVVPFTASAATISNNSEISGGVEYEKRINPGKNINGYTYNILDDGTAEITQYTGIVSELNIPSTIDGYKITSICDYAFAWYDKITSITIPNSVTSIGCNAFYQCSSLTSITIPDSVTFIDSGKASFDGCSSLVSLNVNDKNVNYSSIDGVLFNKNKTELIAYPAGKSDKNYTIPNSVTSISAYAFFDCTSLTSITIPDSVTSIGNCAFSSCENLTNITIPDSVTSIGDSTFSGCSSLTNIKIPDSVTSIGDSTFSGCSSLTNIKIPDSVTSIGDDAFYYTAWFNNQPDGLVYAGKVAYEYKGEMPENTSLIIKDGTKRIDSAFAYCENLTNITIPDSVTSIGDSTFSGCSSLTNIKIPDSVTSIGDGAFCECTNLKSVTIPNSVTNIGDSAFADCYSLTSITIPDSVTSIGYSAFCGCTSLTSITIPDSVTSIDERAFSDTAWFNNQPDGLVYAGKVAYKYKGEMPENTSLIIKDGTKRINVSAFADCYNLTNITIPDSVTNIGDSAFADCYSLTSINVNNNNVNYSSIDGVLFNKNKTELIKYPQEKTVENYTIPNSVISIGKRAFADCYNLTNITIPDSVTSIGNYAFDGCTSLTSITIPHSVTSIDDDTFSGYSSLTNITIPDSVTFIDDNAFDDCSNLASINVNNNNVNYSSIDGVLFNKNKTELIKYPEGKSDKNYTIPNSVTSIDESAFQYCYNLTNITIPDSVTSIGYDAFEGCTSLTNIAIPDNVTSIGYDAFYDTAWFNNQPDGLVYAGKVAYEYKGEMPENTSLIIKDGTKRIDSAFAYCENLTSITIPNSVTCIGDSAFAGCDSLTNITIPDSVTSIGSYAFEGCTSLTNIAIPDNVTSIGYFAFHKCKNLTSINVNSNNTNYSSINGVLFNKNKTDLITYPAGKSDKNYNIPESVTTIDNSAFSYCENITSITIPDSVTSIGYSAFYRCTGLVSVIISNSVTIFGMATFYNCTNLKNITIPDSVTSIGNFVFYGCLNLANITIPDNVSSIGRGAFGYGDYNHDYDKNDNFTITGYKGTAAEKYANENGFKFIALGDSTNPTVPTDPNNPDDPANPTPDNTSKPSLGDIDGDGKISVNDVTDIQKYIVKLKPFTDEQMKFADVDKNGKIDVNDVTLLQKVIVKIAVI